MANTLLSVFRKPLSLCTLGRINNIGLASLYAQDIKHLFSRSALGLDGFDLQRERTKNQMANIVDKFKEKMSESVISESKNMIFTEDLKNMVHLAENDEDIHLTIEMLKRYNKQNKSLRFGNYIFGPVVMRMLYLHNKPDLALECFKSEELSGLFDQFISFQLVLDLLYENSKFRELLDVFKLITERQLEGQRYPRNTVALALAACYKLNDPEALEYALKLWSDLHDVGHQPMRRATTFCAGLALNQGKPEIALEILTAARNHNYTTVRNLKLATLADLGRVDDVIPILKSVLSEDLPQGNIHTFNSDVFEKVKQAVTKSDNPELTLEFNRLEQLLKKEGHVTDITLDTQLCSEIQKSNVMLNRNSRQQEYQPRQNVYNNRFQPRQQRTDRFSQRPGLTELV